MLISTYQVNNDMHITMKPIKYENINKNCNIIFVIDTSGSMDIIASEKNENGECDDLTRLNLACHSIKTIIESLSENDEIGIISFSSIAYKKLEMTKMDENGKENAKLIINNLNAHGTTNIYDGLKKSFELLSTIRNNNNNSIVLLTDGESNADPPSGILNTLIQCFKDVYLKPFSRFKRSNVNRKIWN
jgi:Mg-chelatase subunit ChlD